MIDIDERSDVPIHVQLKQQLILNILSGKLDFGDKLPSIRSLAKILKINPNTVAKVYYSLEEEGYIEAKVGKGYWVKYRQKKGNKIAIGIVKDELKKLFEKSFEMGISKDELKELIEEILR